MVDINIIKSMLDETLSAHFFEEYSENTINTIEREIALKLSNIIDYDLDYEINTIISDNESKLYINVYIDKYNMLISSMDVIIKGDIISVFFDKLFNSIRRWFK